MAFRVYSDTETFRGPFQSHRTGDASNRSSRRIELAKIRGCQPEALAPTQYSSNCSQDFDTVGIGSGDLRDFTISSHCTEAPVRLHGSQSAQIRFFDSLPGFEAIN